ncbi:hypothetical protein HMPREF0620_0395 [Parascardovia denticolens DSM 10105 = JCM 12538]|uniref:Uncharacterized protein n=1 Tax=Parascardovia denticolens DSM 10105 = JCM 12538 TaxID=864564 RepID=E6K0Q9_PARDN|nr:hypothetical protein HMPREF0620_0395 [Parascardovia denticolens DSM 10105 = JCM 12538]
MFTARSLDILGSSILKPLGVLPAPETMGVKESGQRVESRSSRAERGQAAAPLSGDRYDAEPGDVWPETWFEGWFTTSPSA